MVDSTGFVVKPSGGGVALPTPSGASTAEAVPAGSSAYIVQVGHRQRGGVSGRHLDRAIGPERRGEGEAAGIRQPGRADRRRRRFGRVGQRSPVGVGRGSRAADDPAAERAGREQSRRHPDLDRARHADRAAAIGAATQNSDGSGADVVRGRLDDQDRDLPDRRSQHDAGAARTDRRHPESCRPPIRAAGFSFLFRTAGRLERGVGQLRRPRPDRAEPAQRHPGRGRADPAGGQRRQASTRWTPPPPGSCGSSPTPGPGRWPERPSTRCR